MKQEVFHFRYFPQTIILPILLLRRSVTTKVRERFQIISENKLHFSGNGDNSIYKRAPENTILYYKVKTINYRAY